jgi:hypothetical protein
MPRGSTNLRPPVPRTAGVRDQIIRWRRQAEQYRILASVSKTEAAYLSYLNLAADYDDLAERLEETLGATAADADPARPKV